MCASLPRGVRCVCVYVKGEGRGGGKGKKGKVKATLFYVDNSLQ